MNKKGEDRLFDALVRRAIVPKGYRPKSDEEIETMLGALGPSQVSDEKLERMLGNIKGLIPMSWESEESKSPSWQANSAEAQELAAMYRAQGEELPPELEEKLREMEKRAAEPPDEDDDGE